MKEKYLSAASSMAPDLQPVSDVAVEHPRIDWQKVLAGQHRFEPLQQVKHTG